MSAVAADAPSRRPDSSRFRVCQNLLVDVERGLGYFDLAGFGLGAQDSLAS